MLGSEKDKVSAGVNPADNAALEKKAVRPGFPRPLLRQVESGLPTRRAARADLPTAWGGELNLGCARFGFRRLRRGGNVLVDPGFDRILAAWKADQPVDQLAVTEQAQGRDAHHPVADRDVLVDVHVQLADDHLTGVLARKLLHQG